MGIGVLIITHGSLGRDLVDTACKVFNTQPDNLVCYGVADQCDLQAAYDEMQTLVGTLDCSNGLLVLADLYGATPCNIARRLFENQPDTTIVTGINLPMLIKLFSMTRQTREQMSEGLISNGRMGIIIETQGS